MNKEQIINILKGKETRKKAIDKEIMTLFEDLEKCNPWEDNYKLILERIEKLSKLRKEERRVKDVDIGQLFQTIGSFAAIWSILNFEKANVLTSKAFGVFMKGVK